ncbi:MAG: histone deacetylase family protein [Roseibium album]|uniref:Acetylpolyamine aminohydrolase n=1 Tax=Roseibium album TaxID=311410 RepID=A0A0M7AW09_9HYPH|nr:histone deacetylase family protein [Roseibium album]MBG6161979.1 acetoin utilization deacetylase AcuC-like enzyme [Labrenzia sp. EL_195]MCR9058585.1 histone deacetylase family protein [Paracoccaceae bacterium]CTQ62055.1 Acetylpolyamine aminohydrolase [Roseibium album]CTQ78420.1 Acetylpolyamine aminohydrolase [Roseibium album]CTQ79820.1 Acetylpolyamine aminohydrolase [Roseibium album]
MKTVFSDLQLAHAPAQEISDGELKPAVEIPRRAEIVLETVRQRKVGDVVGSEEFPIRPLQRVHASHYVSFLESFWGRWTEAGRTKEAFPFVWPIRSLRQDVEIEHIDGLLGRYSMDAGTPVGEFTYQAARASANTALTGAKLILDGEKSAFALCRPPGHHAGFDFYGGYCFFNNAAVAAQYLRDYGLNRVAILDVDYHHGNGTQALFYDRPDVLFLSIHADPKNEYPYFLGFADETGEHAGTGFTRNWPLPLGTDWDAYTPALEEACRWLLVYKPDAMIVSLGLDCFENDPISGFRFKSEDYILLGQRLAKVGVPTLFLLEGGYAVDALGTNCVNVLEGFGGS